MAIAITPPIGSKGAFKLAAPFDRLVEAGIEYTCIAIRRLSDYVASNEKPEDLIYKAYQIESVYAEDMDTDAYVATLQSRRGHILLVPQRYILDFPSGSGHRYRSVSLVFALPSIPVVTQTTDLQDEIALLIKARLGVDSKSKVVETSLVTLIEDEKHIEITARRNAEKSANGSYEELVHLRHQNAELLTKLRALEAALAS